MNSIFDSKADAIVNPVNCVGVMGGGLARAFRERYPQMNRDYQQACARGEVKVGRMWQWYSDDENRWIINFPTKLDWRDPSKMSYIIDGLDDLRLVVADLRLRSIAIPALGCGLGGLDWVTVKAAITISLDDLNIDLELYDPR